MTPKQQKEKTRAIARTRDLLRLQNKAFSTEQVYLHWLASYIDWLVKHGKDLPDSRTRLEAYLTHLAHQRVSASTQNQAFNALLFYYSHVRKESLPDINALRARRPTRTRTAIPKAQTLALLDAIPNIAGYPTQFVARLLYGLGLRVSEPLNLRIKDVDTTNSRITLRGCKGGKDRTLYVPCSLMAEIEHQIKRARVVFDADRVRALPVAMPGQLAAKYPRSAHAWSWFWLFPAHRACVHPRSGEIVRYRMHESNVQRAVKIAATKLELEGLVTPHVLRHCFSTHVLDAGGNIRDLQEHLGHAHLETTMVYTHGNAGRIISPLAPAMR